MQRDKEAAFSAGKEAGIEQGKQVIKKTMGTGRVGELFIAE